MQNTELTQHPSGLWNGTGNFNASAFSETLDNVADMFGVTPDEARKVAIMVEATYLVVTPQGDGRSQYLEYSGPAGRAPGLYKKTTKTKMHRDGMIQRKLQRNNN